MPAGFQSFVPGGGVIQIDQDYLNYSFAEMQTHWIAESFGYGGGPADQGCCYADIDIAGGADNLIGFYQNSNGACFEVLSSNGITTRYRFFRAGQAPGPINIVIFRPNYQGANGNVGRQVFRADGSIAYDSTRPYLRVLDFFSYSLGSYSEEVRNYTVPVAIIQCYRGYSQNQDPAGGGAVPASWVYTQYGDFFRSSGGQAIIRNHLMVVQSHPGGETPPYSQLFSSLGAGYGLVANMQNIA